MNRVPGFTLLRLFAVTSIFIPLLTTPVFAQPGGAASQRAHRENQNASADGPLQFLIDSAAADFHAHRPPDPAEFRHVRIGHRTAPDGAKQYMLCGEFLPAAKEGKAKWMSFVTIKTSGYEQYLGDQSANFCKQYKVTWDSNKDLSGMLKSKLESLETEAK